MVGVFRLDSIANKVEYFQIDGEFVYFNDYQNPGHVPDAVYDEVAIIRRIANP